jgi:aspartate/methionine/tyrosine aminotransferase
VARATAAARDEGVVVTNGSAEANYLAFQELVRRDDDVVILVPTYMQTYGLAENAGARVVAVPLREEHGWQPDPDDIRAAVTERTRVIVVTNPGNPTGAVLHDEVLDAVVDAAARTGAWILADEVYAGAETAGPRTPSLLGRHERVIATGSLSKAWGLAGLRIGWAATDAAMAERIWARSDYTTISTGELTDRLACLALEPRVSNAAAGADARHHPRRRRAGRGVAAAGRPVPLASRRRRRHRPAPLRRRRRLRCAGRAAAYGGGCAGRTRNTFPAGSLYSCGYGNSAARPARRAGSDHPHDGSMRGGSRVAAAAPRTAHALLL